LVEQTQLAPELRAADFAAEQLTVFADRARDVRGESSRNSTRKWRTPNARSRATYSAPVCARALKDRVAAAGVRFHRMGGPHAVAQLHRAVSQGRPQSR
jgi:hypothetical protein